MATDIIQVQHEELAAIAQRFQQHARAYEEQRVRLAWQVDRLAAGAWEGYGANAFFTEMRRDILPAIRRLVVALEQSSLVTMEICRLLRQAEEEAAEPFRQRGGAFGPEASAMIGAAGIAGSIVSLPALSTAASVLANLFKGIRAGTRPERFVLLALTPNLARGNTTVAMLMDMHANNGRGLPLLRFDGPHGGTLYPHINVNPRLTNVPDPHYAISPRLLNAAGRGARILEGARKIALPVAIGVDVFRLGSALHADGGQIGVQTTRTTASIAGGWGGSWAGAKLGAAGGAMLGGTVGTFFPVIGTAVGAGVGGFAGGIVGGIGGWSGGSWAGEKLVDLF